MLKKSYCLEIYGVNAGVQGTPAKSAAAAAAPLRSLWREHPVPILPTPLRQGSRMVLAAALRARLALVVQGHQLPQRMPSARHLSSAPCGA